MKILQINAVTNIASTGRTTAELADFLESKGHSYYICYSEEINEVTHKNLYQIGGKLGKKVHALLSRVLGLQGYFSSYSTKKLISHIKLIAPDIIQLRNLHGNYINIYMLLKFLAKENYPVVITLHDCFFYTGKCTNYTLQGCYNWQDVCGSCPRIKKDNSSWLFDFSKKMHNDKKKSFEKIRYLAVVGVSDWVTNDAKKSILKNARIIKRIYNWIDLDKFKPMDTSKLKKSLGLENKFVILSIANKWFLPENAVITEKICKSVDDNTKILVLGCNKDHLNKLPANVIGVPYITNEKELAQYYGVADCFLNLSLEDSFGKVTAESLACGTPVIAYNSNGANEIVAKNCGYIVAYNDHSAILNYIEKIKELTKSYYTPYCREFTQKNFSKEDRAMDYLNLYKELVQMKKDG